MQTKNMRLPTCEEWNRLVELTNGDDDIMHWSGVYSWCQDCDFTGTRMVRGNHNSRYMCRTKETERWGSVGFRPVFQLPVGTTAREGSLIMAGTLYMNGEPVKIPKRPKADGDIQDYIPGATLELGAPLVDPDYQISAIRVGDVLIADRVLLKNISWSETGGALPLFFVTEAYGEDANSEVIAVAKTREAAWQEMYQAFVCRIELLNSIDENPAGPHPLPIPSKEEARAGWGKTLDGVWGYISQDHATITDDGGRTEFSISEFAVDRNLVF